MTTTIKKAFTAVVAMVMALVLMVPAGAAYAAGTGSITITPPANTPSTATNIYKIYKVFDADGNGTNISYKLCDGDTLSAAMMNAGFSVDDAGNVSGPTELSQNAITAIANYVTNADLVATVTSTGTTAATQDDLDNGYYYITTSTGTAVTITSTNPDATVKDKNAVPTVNKVISAISAGSISDQGKKAIAQVGSTVTYTATINIPANAKNENSSKNVIFLDKMDNTLTYITGSVLVKVDGTTVPGTNYTLTENGTDATIKIAFNDEYIKTLAANTNITVSYKATVSSDALTASPAKNSAKVTYGDRNASTDPSVTEVYNAKVTVTKKFEGLTGTLANGDSAQFVLKNADGKYYAISDAKVVSWVDSLDNATKLTYTQAGSQEFTGLADGTYTLVESKTPAGYKTAADTTVTVAKGTYTTENLEKTASITNLTGSALPTTGGMGTTLMYTVGAALVIGAGALLIARKRNTQE